MKTLTPMQSTALASALALALLAPTASAQTLPAAGTRNSGTSTFANSRKTAGEFIYATRILASHPDVVVPRRMYTATCVNPSGTRRIFQSLTTVATEGGATAGMIVSADVAANGSVSNFKEKLFSECNNMAGIVVDSTCGTVAALCRRDASTNTPTVDLVKTLPNTTEGNKWRNWITSTDRKNSNGTVDYTDHMWLYEWSGSQSDPTSANSTPARKFIVSKAIGGKENAHHDLVMNDTYYGVSLKSTGDAWAHEFDSFIVFTRSNPAIDMSRGWPSGCGTGHTRSNRPATSANGTFAVFCTTDDYDGLDSDPVPEGGAWLHVDQKDSQRVHQFFMDPENSLKLNGGASVLIPKPGGGYLGMLVGSADASKDQATRIGLVHFAADGTPGAVKWVKTDSSDYLSYPQLAYLGKDADQNHRFLLGWGQMMPFSTTSTFISPSPGMSARMPFKYFVQEIDWNGTAKSQPVEIANGWGEQDRMVSLGNKRVGWVYRPKGGYELDAAGNVVKKGYSTQLIWMTYTSTSM